MLTEPPLNTPENRYVHDIVEHQHLDLILSSLACFSSLVVLTSALNGCQPLVRLSRSARKLLAFYATLCAVFFVLNV
jgi:hypothetical protein